MSTLSIATPGANVHVVDEGLPDAPTVVLLHAGIADSRAWEAMTPRLVAAGYRVVAYDRRGFGRTVTEPVEFSNRADLVAVIDALGLDQVAIVGNSQGGQIAIDAAIEYPDRIVAVVAVAPGLSGFEAEPTPDEMAAFDQMDALETRLDEAGAAGDPEALREIVELDVAFWVNGPGQPADRAPAAIRELVAAMDTDIYEPGRERGQAIPLRPPAGERLDELRQPLLAVVGALDASECIATVEHLGANAPSATAVVWPDVAHMIGLEAPERLADLVIEFLAPLPRWT